MGDDTLNAERTAIDRGPKLPWALAGAIGLSLVLTGISVTMYSLNGSSKLDLSRPGYERERSEVRTNDSPRTYDTTSPVTKGAIDTFLQEYDTRGKEMGTYGDFNDHVLEDSDLQLSRQSVDGVSQ